MKIEITMEKMIRITKEFEVTDKQLSDLEGGENPFFDEMKNEIESNITSCDIEYDYAVNDEEGRSIVDWN